MTIRKSAVNRYFCLLYTSGAFTPAKEGTYTITVQAKAGNKVVSDSKVITVATSMTGIAQMAANKVAAVYSGNAKNLVKTCLLYTSRCV